MTGKYKYLHSSVHRSRPDSLACRHRWCCSGDIYCCCHTCNESSCHCNTPHIHPVMYDKALIKHELLGSNGKFIKYICVVLSTLPNKIHFSLAFKKPYISSIIDWKSFKQAHFLQNIQQQHFLIVWNITKKIPFYFIKAFNKYLHRALLLSSILLQYIKEESYSCIN